MIHVQELNVTTIKITALKLEPIVQKWWLHSKMMQIHSNQSQMVEIDYKTRELLKSKLKIMHFIVIRRQKFQQNFEWN